MPYLIPLSSLRDENVVRDLIAENRTPFLIREEETVICFIPPNKTHSAQSLEVSIADAKEIASIRDKLNNKAQNPGA